MYTKRHTMFLQLCSSAHIEPPFLHSLCPAIYSNHGMRHVILQFLVFDHVLGKQSDLEGGMQQLCRSLKLVPASKLYATIPGATLRSIAMFLKEHVTHP